MDEDRLPSKKSQRSRTSKTGSRGECVDQLRSFGDPRVEQIIALCTKIRIDYGKWRESTKGRDTYEVRIRARYCGQDLDSGFIRRDLQQEATGIAIGIITKSG